MSIRLFLEKGYRVVGEKAGFKVGSKPTKGARLVIDTKDYRIYEYSYGSERVIAAYENMIVVQKRRRKNHIVLYPYSQNRWIRYNIYLNDTKFPGLLPGSEILSCQLIPYMREVEYHKYQRAIRLVIITTKSQIYHNFPARHTEIEGYSQAGDIVRFEESVVWDLPDRKYPSKEKACDAFERYYPGLPDICYEYHPMYNMDPKFKDTYKNGGFAKTTKIERHGQLVQVPRFYIYSRNDVSANPFYFIGMGEKEYKLSLMATYRSNIYCGVRTGIFASSDGGRSWYCKYEFADAGDYEFAQGDVKSWGRNFGNPVKATDLEIQWENVEVKQRKLCIPNSNEKEPQNKFQWLTVGNVKHASQKGQLILELKNVHSLKTGNIIALSTNEKSQVDAWIFNNEVTPNSNIPCRHIHHVNRIKDGWIFGTGEIYPNGWIFYLQMKEADTFSVKHAWEEFEIIRLNSTKESVQRTMGGILMDNKDGTFLYASDHDTLEREEAFSIPGRNISVSRNSTGVFSGKIADIDNRNKFEVIYEATEPCFYFQQLSHMIIFCGQRGEVGISFDSGKTWKRERITGPIILYYGNCGQVYYFDSSILIRK